MFCHGTQTMQDLSLLFHEHSKQKNNTLCSRQGSYYATHMLGLNFTMMS